MESLWENKQEKKGMDGMAHEIYATKYAKSRALIIGINKYLTGSPLEYAVNDAKVVRETLIDKFGFKNEDIKYLSDEDATKERIMSSFLSYANNQSNPDDKIIFFFAGHGFTLPSKRGEVGYLIPYDAEIENLSSLIRWDDLTRNADLIKAKHLLFIMDACYGGLAITRSLPPGTMRFVKNMLTRYSRQVLTAGKADEVVADSGGPRPKHSVFTGHFLDALSGNAETPEGVLTANGIMAYVYQKVANDPNSHQTPHYGFLDGDGDFIFKAPILDEPSESSETETDVLISVPAVLKGEYSSTVNIIEETKEYLSDNRFKIKLHDLASIKLREYFSNLLKKDLQFQMGIFNADEFNDRLKFYEELARDLQLVSICIAYWGGEQHRLILQKIISRSTDPLEPIGGSNVWLYLRWYPIILLAYSAGISAVASGNYALLADVLLRKCRSSDSSTKNLALAISLGEASAETHEAFKLIPGHGRNYFPRSEYLFKYLQPMIDDVLFLGRDYEQMFDKFEIFLALVCADLSEQQFGHFWGPPGRFKNKYRNGLTDPLAKFAEEAKEKRADWGPLKHGFFDGSYERFEKIVQDYLKP